MKSVMYKFKSIVMLQVFLLIFALCMPSAVSAQSVSLNLDKTSAAAGDTLTASGTVASEGLFVKILDADNTIAFLDYVKADESGNYSKNVILPSGKAEGTWSVVAGQGTDVASATFMMGSAQIEQLTIIPGTIVQGHLSYIHVKYGSALNNAEFAMLDADDKPIGTPVKGTNGKASFDLTAPDEPGMYDIVALVDGQVKGKGQIEVLPYNMDIWLTRTAPNDEEKLVIHFNEPFSTKDGKYDSIATASTGDKIVSEQSSDGLSLITDMDYEYAKDNNVIITIKGVKYPRLYPSFSFTFTATVDE